MFTFPKQTYVERRERLSKTMGSGLLLFLGNGIASMNYADNNYQFRQDSTFLYLFGLDYENLAAVIDIDNNRVVVFGDELSLDDIVWTGPQPSLYERAAKVGVTEVQPLDDLFKYVADAQSRHQAIHYIPAYRGHTVTWYKDLLGADAKPSLDLIYALADMRNHKSAEEIEQIELAINVSRDMHLRALEIVRPGMTEKEVAAAVAEVCLREGYYFSFPSICTSHGETLHNHGYIHTLRDGDLLLLDAGAEVDSHYAGDLTTTMPVGKDYTPRQKEVYNILIETYRNASSAIRPGIMYSECHNIACRTIAEGLKGLGLMKGDPAEAASAGAVGLFLPHGLGHMMGLDVHDMENYGEMNVGYPRGAERDHRPSFAALRLNRVLEPGFVFTCEPGIYFIPELIDKWQSEGKFKEYINYDKLEAWRDFGGMRNEEDYLVTPDGYRHLGKDKPCEVEQILAAKGYKG